VSLIDFKAVAEAALARGESLLAVWLPGGKVANNEYACAGFDGGAGRKLGVNLKSGVWAAFNSDDAGGDLVSLYAAIHGIGQLEAATEVAAQCGMALVGEAPAARSAKRAPSRLSALPPVDDKHAGWQAVMPVPTGVITPSHYSRYRQCEPLRVHAYMTRDGELLGYVRVYPTSDGGKLPMPLTFCQHATDGYKWIEKAFPEPRPLYLAHWPRGVLLGHNVVVVEGEKCADALAALPAVQAEGWCVVSWPGGAAVPQKADWSLLGGAAQVVLWPDCDSHLARRPRPAKDASELCGPMPLLAERDQPGVKAMLKVESALEALGARDVRWVAIPPPGEVDSGWDVADEIARGDTPAAILAKIRGARSRDIAPVPALAKSEHKQGLASAGSGNGEKERNWRDDLLRSEKGFIKPARANAVLALEQAPELKELLGFDEFTNSVDLLRDAPWGTPRGGFGEVDELHLGDFLVRGLSLPEMARQTLDEAVRTVADRHKYHPVRRWLHTLEWDGRRRLKYWIAITCKATPWEQMQKNERAYLARVSKWFVMALVKRVLEPGCKFDYMTIFEGSTGLGKSTLLKVLGGPWFADTGLQMDNKDSYQNLQGKLLYEFGEMDHISKSTLEKIKSFTASSCDRFRASFDRRARDYPRQCCFAGTTNQRVYLTDKTGNRRSWPVKVDKVVDLEWLIANRDQLFAEALVCVTAGERIAPTREEEESYFKAEQAARMVDDPIEQLLYQKLTSIEHSSTESFTLAAALILVGADLTKGTPSRFIERQVADAFTTFGWEHARRGKDGDQRAPRAYWRPSGWPEQITTLAPAQLTSSAPGLDQPLAQASTESDDDLPF
jgi:putative DNA primase/helicase